VRVLFFVLRCVVGGRRVLVWLDLKPFKSIFTTVVVVIRH
jgi:hypothetical protein